MMDLDQEAELEAETLRRMAATGEDYETAARYVRENATDAPTSEDPTPRRPRPRSR